MGWSGDGKRNNLLGWPSQKINTIQCKTISYRHMAKMIFYLLKTIYSAYLKLYFMYLQTVTIKNGTAMIIKKIFLLDP